MTEKELEIVSRSFLFADFDKEAVRGVIKTLGGYVRTAPKGKILIQEGDVVEYIGIILSGEVRIFRLDFEGKETLFQKLCDSYMVGADIVSTPAGTSPYMAVCGEETKIWYFLYEGIRNPGKIEETKRMAIKERLLEFIANENIRKFYKVDMLSSGSAREKIWKYLKVQCTKAGSSKVSIPYNREELANYLCMNRSVLSHTLSEMKKEGVLEFRKNQFVLKREWKD